MSHPLVLGLYQSASAAASGARAVHVLGVPRDRISVVARSHDEEGALANQMDATPGADIEDSRPAGVLGELGANVLAAIALVMPGIGPIVAAGPLSAGLGAVAGHVAGSVTSALTSAGVPEADASAFEREVQAGAVLLGVHVSGNAVSAVRDALSASGADRVVVANWNE
jgi:hypothetical protein